MDDTGKIVQLKERAKAMIVALGEVSNSRALSLTRTKLEEACMWVDFELRTRGVGVQPEVPVEPQTAVEQKTAELQETVQEVTPQPVAPQPAMAALEL